MICVAMGAAVGRMGVLAAAVCVVGACGSDDGETAGDDQAIEDVCSDAAEIVRDYDYAILDMDDFANRFTDIVASAEGTELHAPAVDAREAAQRHDDPGIVAAVDRMNELCGSGD